jgi:choline dehydrogenase
MSLDPEEHAAANFAHCVRANQRKLRANLKPQYDFIICGSGSSGSVVARRLAENPKVTVLLLEAGGDDDVPSVMQAHQWATNLGTERDWQFKAEPNPHLNGRALPLGMGKVLGGGSSINGSGWFRGHQSDWNFFASQSGDSAWGYQSVLNTYRRIEDWHGDSDPEYRGTGGPAFVQPAPNPDPIHVAMLQGACSVGIPTFSNHNGHMMEGEGGASVTEVRIRDGKRQSVFRSYVFPYINRPNLTVLSHSLVMRLIFDGRRAVGVEVSGDCETYRVSATLALILSLGAINTPKVLMQSGVGDAAELQRFGIPVVQHLPGVGYGFQDHPAFGCVWEDREPQPRSSGAAVLFWNSRTGGNGPDLQILQPGFPLAGPENSAKFGLPASGWTLLGSVIQPKSQGVSCSQGPTRSTPFGSRQMICAIRTT